MNTHKKGVKLLRTPFPPAQDPQRPDSFRLRDGAEELRPAPIARHQDETG